MVSGSQAESHESVISPMDFCGFSIYISVPSVLIRDAYHQRPIYRVVYITFHQRIFRRRRKLYFCSCMLCPDGRSAVEMYFADFSIDSSGSGGNADCSAGSVWNTEPYMNFFLVLRSGDIAAAGIV